MKPMFLLLLSMSAIPAMGASAARARTNVDACSLPTVRSIQVPVYPDKPGSPKFVYRYQAYVKDLRLPTIVYLPGGPGGDSIADWSGRPELVAYLKRIGMPQNANYVFLDPRGGGCNAANEKILPDEALTTLYTSHDVLAAIHDLKPSQYYLYGVSYGSLWATVVASLAEKLGAQSPAGTLLMGVMGHAVRGVENSFSGHLIQAWKAKKRLLPGKALERLSVDKPLGLDAPLWVNYIYWALRAGRFQTPEGRLKNEFVETLSLMASDDPAQLETVRKRVLEINNLPPLLPFSPRLVVVDCTEITDSEYNFRFVHGELEIKPMPNYCAQIPQTRPFDAAQWKSSNPIYYVQGMDDLVTPYKMHAFYHVGNQIYAPRFVALVPEMGHLLLGAIMADCSQNIWESIFHGGRGFESAIRSCQAPSHIKILGRQAFLRSP